MSREFPNSPCVPASCGSHALPDVGVARSSLPVVAIASGMDRRRPDGPPDVPKHAQETSGVLAPDEARKGSDERAALLGRRSCDGADFRKTREGSGGAYPCHRSEGSRAVPRQRFGPPGVRGDPGCVHPRRCCPHCLPEPRLSRAPALRTPSKKEAQNLDGATRR